MSMYDGILEVGSDGLPIEPTLVLSSRGGHKIGVIKNATNIEITHPLSDVAELSFDVYKQVGDKKYKDWDKLKDFKLVQIPRENTWFEAKVSLDEEDDIVKHVTCTHANESELGQLNLYDVEINTEADIDRDDYKPTFFYREDDPGASLLNRILRDKAPHYQIYHVDDTLKGLFRQFSFNGTSIQDALNQIGQECDCLFVYGEWYENDGKYHRTISAYDLEDYCHDCGKRGTYTDGHCTNCGSENVTYGYGEDMGIFVSRENLATSINYETNIDDVKNCFRLSGGDDVMTAAIKSCNPNMSSYIWHFSDEMLEDMSEELQAKLEEYTALVDRYSSYEPIPVSEELVSKHNELVDIYGEYNDALTKIDYPILGTAKLVDAYYNATNLYGFLKSGLNPASDEVTTTTAEEQIQILKKDGNMARVGIADASGTIPKATANSAIQSYAKVFVDTSRYKVSASTTNINGKSWTGTITVKSYTDDEDTASATFNITLFDGTNNEEYTDWVKQSVDKAMANREVTDLSVIGLFDSDVTLEDFKERIQLYSLDNLSMMNNMATSALTIMIEQGIANEGETQKDVYTGLYAPYHEKAKALKDELVERETQLSYLMQPLDENGNIDPRFPNNGLLDDIGERQNDIMANLNIEEFLGDDLWQELSFYRREDEYQNPNFISDGLTDSEIVDYAQKFYDTAYKEIIKSSTLQHKISAPLINFLLMEKFKPLQTKFKVGNWLRLKVDGKVCKLRLVNWTVDYDDIESLDVEFSDVIRAGNLISDTQSILSKARSMSTTYGFISRQADKGWDASETLDDYKERGLDFSKIKVIQSKGNTNIVYDDDGILLKKTIGTVDLPEQARIYNNGIYVTRDGWATVSTGLGHYSYVDPETGMTIETYGLIADTVMGKLILGDNLGIYSESGNLKMDRDGLTLTGYDGDDEGNLFTLQRDNGDGTFTQFIHVDRGGNAVINGNAIVLGVTPLETYLDDEFTEIDGELDTLDGIAQAAMRVANDYLSFDNGGAMVANMVDGYYYKPSNIPSNHSNVLITDSNVQIRDGQHVLAQYGSDIYVGNDTEQHVYISSSGIDLVDGNADHDLDVTLAHFGDTITLGDVNNEHVYIDSTGVDIMDGANSLAKFGSTIRIGDEEGGHTNIGAGGMTVYGANNNTVIELANIGYGSGNGYEHADSEGSEIISPDGTAYYTAPYYTFGVRTSGGIIGNYSVVEGYGNTASGYGSHAEGKDNVAKAAYTHVSGIGNTANFAGQAVFGKYAIPTTSSDLFVVGKGYSNSNRQNAMRLMFNGHVEFNDAIGTGLKFNTRTIMRNKFSSSEYSLNTPYSFYGGSDWADSAVGSSLSGSYAFGIISKASSETWQLLFMTGQKVFKSTFTYSSSSFKTEQLYSLEDINTYFTNKNNKTAAQTMLANVLEDYAKTDDIPSITGYVTTDYLTQNYTKTGQDSTYAKFNDVYTISDVQRLFVPVGVNDNGESLKYVLNSNCTRFKNAVDAILKGYGLIT